MGYNKIVKATAQKLTNEEIQKTLGSQLKNWTFANNALRRDYTLKNFEQTWAFLNQIAMRSHLWGHHPTITTTYNKVSILLTTHDLAGVTDIDIKFAKRIDGYNTQLTKE